MTTMTIDSARQQIFDHLDKGRGYEFLTLVAPYLYAVPDDHYARLMAVREYLKLALVVPARELLDYAPVGGDMPEELASLREVIDTLPGTDRSWSACQERYAANLASLEQRGVDVAPIREAWSKRCSRYQRFRDSKGLDQLRMRTEHGRWQWIPCMGDHHQAARAKALPTDVKTYMPGPYLFEGLDFGLYFERVYEATQDTFHGYSCPLFVVEPDAALVAMVLHLRDWAKLLGDERIYWFVGDGWADRLRRVWDDDIDLSFPRQAFVNGAYRAGGPAGAVDVVQQAARAREQQLRESYQDTETQYASRDIKYWAKRFSAALAGEGPPLRVLTAVSTHTTFLKYSVRDTKRALEAMGHSCRVLTEHSAHTAIGTLRYHDEIRDLDPDLFLSIDHLRTEFEVAVPPNLPVLTWDQDQLPHVFTRENMERIGPLDFMAGYSAGRCRSAGCDRKQLLYARVPTCPKQFSGQPLTEEEQQRYGCDVSFVSHASQTPAEFHQEERARFSDADTQRFLDLLFELTGPLVRQYGIMNGAVAMLVLEEASRQYGQTVTDPELRQRLINWYLWRLGDRIFRHEALEWAAEWARQNGRTLRIYGNGWDKHPTLSAFATGPAQNGRELLCIYRASKINLQLMPAGFVHQRALDGLAAGGFFLGRQTPDDLRGKTLRRLALRITELGVDSNVSLANHTDPTLYDLLRAYRGEWLERIDADEGDLLNNILMAAELVHPEEVFPRFDEILFNSAEQFARHADRFLADEAYRSGIADEMRQVVIEHFSYRSTMEQFLRAMTDYLTQAAR